MVVIRKPSKRLSKPLSAQELAVATENLVRGDGGPLKDASGSRGDEAGRLRSSRHRPYTHSAYRFPTTHSLPLRFRPLCRVPRGLRTPDRTLPKPDPGAFIPTVF